MTGPLADFFDEDAQSVADLCAKAAAAAAPPDPWGLADAYLGPTVEVRKYRPFGDNAPRNDAVWAVVDREQARERLVHPPPLTDPALLNRDDNRDR